MKLELLFFDGCPAYERMLPRLRELTEAAGAELVLRSVDTPAAAEAERFLGSPTLRVDGLDVEPGADLRTDFGLKCRIYRSEEHGQSALPPTGWVEAALQRSAGR